MSAAPPRVTAFTNQTVARVLLLYLAREGVTTIFGMPGGGVANLLVELKNQRDRFEYVVCRHETGAAYIADGYFRATGMVGVVVVTSGPGATNALTGAMTAQNDGSGLLLVSGEVSEQYFGKGYLQEGIDSDLDVHAIYKAASGYSAEVTDQSEVQTLLEQALRDALGIPRGTAHLSLPNNVAAEIVTTPQPPPLAPSPTIQIPNSPANYRTVPSGADRDLVHRAAAQLLACKRPLIFLGSGCRDALRDTATTRAARGLRRAVRHSGDDHTRRQGRLPRRPSALAAGVRIREQHLGAAVDAAAAHAIRRPAGPRDEPPRALEQQLQSHAGSGGRRTVHPGRSRSAGHWTRVPDHASGSSPKRARSSASSATPSS